MLLAAKYPISLKKYCQKENTRRAWHFQSIKYEEIIIKLQIANKKELNNRENKMNEY